MSDSTAPAPASVATVVSTDLIKNLLLGAQATTAALAAIGSQYDLSVDEWLILDGLESSDGATMSEVSVSTRLWRVADARRRPTGDPFAGVSHAECH